MRAFKMLINKFTTFEMETFWGAFTRPSDLPKESHLLRWRLWLNWCAQSDSWQNHRCIYHLSGVLWSSQNLKTIRRNLGFSILSSMRIQWVRLLRKGIKDHRNLPASNWTNISSRGAWAKKGTCFCLHFVLLVQTEKFIGCFKSGCSLQDISMLTTKHDLLCFYEKVVFHMDLFSILVWHNKI